MLRSKRLMLCEHCSRTWVSSSPDPVIVHRVLECQYHAQVDRVEESAQATSPNSGSSDEIWALGELLATLKAGADSAREERRRRGSRH